MFIACLCIDYVKIVEINMFKPRGFFFVLFCFLLFFFTDFATVHDMETIHIQCLSCGHTGLTDE